MLQYKIGELVEVSCCVFIVITIIINSNYDYLLRIFIILG